MRLWTAREGSSVISSHGRRSNHDFLPGNELTTSRLRANAEASPLMTPAALKSYSHKDLAQMAKQGGVRGWHSMRKDQLVKALLTTAKPKAAASNGQESRGPGPPLVAGQGRRAHHRPQDGATRRVQRHISQVKAKLERSKNIASDNGKPNGHVKERIVVMVRDPYWLHAYWEVKRQSVERVQAAMSQDWHTARPYLRLLEVSDGGSTSGSERVIRDIEVHGGVSNWYVHVDNSPSSYRLELGYMGSAGRFYPLVRSNVVSTPEPGSSDAIDENWTDVAENFDKIYAMSGGYSPDNNSLELQELFEERLRRPMGSPMVTRYGSGMGRHVCRLAGLQVRGRRRDDRLRRHQSQFARQPAWRAGAAASRRHVYGADEPAQSAAGDSGRGQRRQRRRAADDRAGRRAQHEGHGTGAPRSQRVACAPQHVGCRPRAAELAVPRAGMTDRGDARLAGFAGLPARSHSPLHGRPLG